ncbi:hypothetical protein CVT25_004676 [Psilocybe cyanescens]|uniref:C2H2-type domain-containing protein n=1 Tax=Psilocybe cyanescens TaxID=93625 RepID=A0A409XE80_PSICY|nr:hypothetical protein CVT25_004676 [Psilocybe cyanescens]
MFSSPAQTPCVQTDLSDIPENHTLHVKGHLTPLKDQLGADNSSPVFRCLEASEPSNSFFQASRNVSINGGHFNSTMGHHTNLTIHLGLEAPLSNTEPVHTDSAHSASKGQTEVCSSLSGNIPNVNSEVACQSLRLQVVQPLQMSPSTQKSNEVYEKQLSMKGRGFPLWVPEPNRRLPIMYRREGVSIGDVGIITPSGGFSFLFNICLPADDPINLGRVPEDFEPIYPQLDADMDIREFFEFKQGNYLASKSIKTSKSDALSLDLLFKSKASEGAILTMPEGAISFDLENIPHFRTYAAANVESWYRFVNGPRGREAQNGDIRLVTGCDKTTSWGMAVLSNHISQAQESQTNCLRFKVASDPLNPSACAYTWECSGIVEARVGPDCREIDELRRRAGERERERGLDAADNNDADGKFLNQCLFVRTLNLTLGAESWERLNQELALKIGSMQNRRSGNTSLNDFVSECNAQVESSSIAGHEALTPVSNKAGNQHVISMTTTPEISYIPCYYLTSVLYYKYPAARMVITHDGDWTSAAKRGFLISDQTQEDLLARILDKYDIKHDESASRNVSINGGHFNSTMGHHTNLTIHFGLQPLQMSPSTQKSNEVYEKQLSMKGRGFPLWIPEPNRRLPITYRREGVSIGDVGIITPSGGFSFLFNICLPADDPINRGRVPEDFEPIYPQLDADMDIREFFEFKQGNYLASTSIENSQSDAFSPDLFFESKASEGAILTMPEGAIAFDLENIPHFRTYAAANVESWYRFVNGPRGREAKNGDIRLVTGCDKTTSWGMAVLSNHIAQHAQESRTNCLRFKAARGDPRNPAACAYTWECSGMVEARVGPDRREIEELRRRAGERERERERGLDAADDDGADGKFLNQCLFVRTLNLTLGAESWDTLNQELALKIGAMQNRRSGNTSVDNFVAEGNARVESSSVARHGAPPSSKAGNQHAISMTTTPEISVRTSDHLNTVTRPVYLFIPLAIPSIKVSERTAYRTSRMVITHDGDWTSAVNGGFAISAQTKADLLARILDKYDIKYDESGEESALMKKSTYIDNEDEGVLYLDAKKELIVSSLGSYSPTEEQTLFRGLEELALDSPDDLAGANPPALPEESECSSRFASMMPDRRRHSFSDCAPSLNGYHPRLVSADSTAARSDRDGPYSTPSPPSDPSSNIQEPRANAFVGRHPTAPPGLNLTEHVKEGPDSFQQLRCDPVQAKLRDSIIDSRRQKLPGRYTCGVPNCHASFSRKLALDNHVKSHLRTTSVRQRQETTNPNRTPLYSSYDTKKQRPATTDGNLNNHNGSKSRTSLLVAFQIWATASTCAPATTSTDSVHRPGYDRSPYTSV